MRLAARNKGPSHEGPRRGTGGTRAGDGLHQQGQPNRPAPHRAIPSQDFTPRDSAPSGVLSFTDVYFSWAHHPHKQLLQDGSFYSAPPRVCPFRSGTMVLNPHVCLLAQVWARHSHSFWDLYLVLFCKTERIYGLVGKKSICTGLNQLGLSGFKCTKEFSFIASSINRSNKCIGWQNVTKSALWLRSCHTPWTLFYFYCGKPNCPNIHFCCTWKIHVLHEFYMWHKKNQAWSSLIRTFK